MKREIIHPFILFYYKMKLAILSNITNNNLVQVQQAKLKETESELRFYCGYK